MKPAVDFAQAASGHMSVDFRRGDTGVAQQFLDDPEVGAMIEQMGGETVTKHVRRHISFETGASGAPLDPQPERDRCEGRAAPG